MGERTDIDRKYRLILEREKSFVRSVAIGIHVKRPLTAWHFFLPGMFIFDFLRRSSEIERYSTYFVYPRKLALDSALSYLKGEDKKKIKKDLEDKTRQWLSSLNLLSEKLLQRQVGQMLLLLDHYTRLLTAVGTNYPELVRCAYGTREYYEAFLDRLTSSEHEIDRAIMEIFGGSDSIRRRLWNEQTQIKDLRKRDVKQIFP